MCRRTKGGFNDYENSNWFTSLDNCKKDVARRIFKAHDYFSRQSRKYKKWVYVIKTITMLSTTINTILLGLSIIAPDVRLIVGFCLSATTMFFSSFISYFNLEKYWIRNISIHIKLNIIRDDFIFYAESDALDDGRLAKYQKDLADIQNDNIIYWEKAQDRI